MLLLLLLLLLWLLFVLLLLLLLLLLLSLLLLLLLCSRSSSSTSSTTILITVIEIIIIIVIVVILSLLPPQQLLRVIIIIISMNWSISIGMVIMYFIRLFILGVSSRTTVMSSMHTPLFLFPNNSTNLFHNNFKFLFHCNGNITRARAQREHNTCNNRSMVRLTVRDSNAVSHLVGAWILVLSAHVGHLDGFPSVLLKFVHFFFC